MLLYILKILVYFLSLIIPLLIAVAYFTLIERQILAAIQRRQGPNVVGFYGLLQPLADGLKLLLKETILPKSSNVIIFILAPVFTFALALVG
jgi:NADH-quinone oxidoreductase subunit H